MDSEEHILDVEVAKPRRRVRRTVWGRIGIDFAVRYHRSGWCRLLVGQR